MYVEQGAPFEASYGAGESGFIPGLQVAVFDNDGNIVIGPTTNDLTEETVGGNPIGVYTWNALAAPAAEGQYVIVWSPDGSWDPATTSSPDELVVTAAGSTGTLPPIPAPEDGGVAMGPCTAWLTGDDVAECCSVETSGGAIFDTVAVSASVLLYELSGRLFSGSCGPKKVRPDCSGCWCGYQVTSGGFVIAPDYWGVLCDLCLVRCNPSLVKLSGYPVREITEVMVNGTALANTEYRLHRNRFAMRLNDTAWPTRQDLTLADDQTGTFSISYTYGQSPPQPGIDAAAQLACELYKECQGQTCALPKGTTRQTRQGIVIEKLAFTSWAFQPQFGWRTGMPLVDAFLSAYNPNGARRQPKFWAPGKRQYAQEWQG